jgi:hypothetical protein
MARSHDHDHDRRTALMLAVEPLQAALLILLAACRRAAP